MPCRLFLIHEPVISSYKFESDQQMAQRLFTVEEVRKHNKEGDLYIVIDGEVYDCSSFADLHPGGKGWLVRNAGTDVSKQFKLYHGEEVMRKYRQRLKIGAVKGYTPKQRIVPPGSFGDLVPFGDPIWYQRFNSPYYKETHIKWREDLRNFFETEIFSTINEWQNDDRPPKDILLKMGERGILACMMGPPFPKDYVDPACLKYVPADYDYFHELILFDELARCGNAAVVAAISNGPAIGLSAIMRFGSEDMKRRVMPDVLMGRKMIALAISEPNAGSDVAGLMTTAQSDGDCYILNGNKKWITNGTYADYFVTAVVTGERGQGGLSFVLVEAGLEGFSRRKVNIPQSTISGTAYLDFNNCRVPKSELIGKENKGFKLIMYNFNHERMYVATVCCRLARVCLEESLKYALRRKTFGKHLHEHQSIRMKIAAMARGVEQLQTWLEYITFQLCTMSHAEANLKIGDVVCLVKVQASKVYEHVARETTQIFGGNALYVGGPGIKIEPAVAQVKGYQIPAGAEDVLDDYSARTAFKMAVQMAKL